ncbi:MAG: TonB-dependent receptor [Sphingobacteriales bacterium]|nr:MAG: TonB-dependent receptor [Sphingobacteriales bacterium]
MQGASVKATHVPSGTVYNTLANASGTFAIQGMRPGGPYRIEVTFVGFNTITLEDIQLNLGESYVVNEKMTGTDEQLSAVTVVSAGRNSLLNRERTGASTNINARQLTTLPTISRSLTDFTRLTPQADGTSFGGRDGRLNSVKIDGANFNNAFGLSSDLLPGGDAQPISLDAVQEVQVNIAPYDVRQSGFTGAGVNAVTKSGTNDFHGTAYTFYRKNMNGKEINNVKFSEAARQAKNVVYGASFGGPIIKNKLFFFGNYENTTYTYAGNPWVANRGTGAPNEAAPTVADLEAVSAYLKNNYNYDPGRYENYANNFENKDEKFLVRLDWNISDKHKFTVRYNQVIGTSDQGTNNNSGPNPRSGVNRISSASIAFENANYKQKNTVRSATAELNSNFSNKLSNQLLATFTDIESIRSTPGDLFPFVDIWEGGQNYITFGTELFSYNNGLKNKNFTVIDNVTYSSGKHLFTGGVSFESMGFDNSYVRLGTSYYRYNSVASFLAGAAPNVYGVTYPYQNDTWAKLRFGMAGAYIQDKITVNERFNVTVGLRADLPLYFDEPLRNPSIDTLKLLNKDGQQTTYPSSSWPKSRVLLSPRIGFNWDVFGNRSLQLRGGTGIFTGLIPFVWFTNQPSNSGVLQNTFEPVNASTLAQITRLEADPMYWVKALPNAFPTSAGTRAPSTIALIDPDFKMPQIWRSNVGADYKIPGTPLIASVDLLFSKDLKSVYQFNANRLAAPGTLNYSGDNRDYWVSSANATYNTATGAIAPVLTNSDKGYSATITAGVTLPYRKGFYGSVFYNFTSAKDITGNPGSAANSAWSNNYSINDPNEQYLSTSQFGVPHRVVGNLSYRIEYLKHLATTISLFYTGSSAGRFAYTYNGDINRDGVSLDLLYVPENAADLTFAPFTSGGVTFSAEEQRAAYERLVNNTKQLKDAKGGYVERNSGLLPWQHRFDFRLLQDIFTNIGTRRHSLQLSVDILNVGNFLNNDWGVRKELNSGSSFNYALLNVAGVTAGVPTFNMISVNDASGKRVLPDTPYRTWFDVRNTWSMQVGLRYIF